MPKYPVLNELPEGVECSLIRGKLCPVVDLARLVENTAPAKRLVLLQLPKERNVALAVTSVEGVFELSLENLAKKPPLLTGVRSDWIESFGFLDGQLLQILKVGALLSEQDWTHIEAQ